MTDEALWGSHLPALMACLTDTDGPVIEFGIGHFSTPVLHAVCETRGRELFSLEQNPEWFHQFEGKFSTLRHQFCLGEYLESIPKLPEGFSVAFIDHSPGGKSRVDVFSAMIGQSSLVVVHDYHLDNEEAIAPLLTGLQTHVTRMYGPPTLVAAALYRIPPGILKL